MKTDLNGVSQCPKGTENYETFYTMVRRKRTKLIQLQGKPGITAIYTEISILSG